MENQQRLVDVPNLVVEQNSERVLVAELQQRLAAVEAQLKEEEAKAQALLEEKQEQALLAQKAEVATEFRGWILQRRFNDDTCSQLGSHLKAMLGFFPSEEILVILEQCATEAKAAEAKAAVRPHSFAAAAAVAAASGNGSTPARARASAPASAPTPVSAPASAEHWKQFATRNMADLYANPDTPVTCWYAGHEYAISWTPQYYPPPQRRGFREKQLSSTDPEQVRFFHILGLSSDTRKHIVDVKRGIVCHHVHRDEHGNKWLIQYKRV